MKLLFSPVGLTDPISNFRDGAMLHICRNYDIDKVYIYLSKEVYEYHLHDNRYLYCLNKLSEIKGKKIEYELIIRKDLVNVHKFDYFVDEFDDLIKEIHSKNPDSELYLNVSSGTPAMKSSLRDLAALSNIKMIPIQVRTPENQSYSHLEEKKNYQPEQMWECNEDNENNINRCSLSKDFNLFLKIKKRMLSELIEKYDYVGAKTPTDSMGENLDKRFVELMDAACMRSRLEYEKAEEIFRKYGFKLLEHESSNIASLSEYFLLLDLKVKKGELADFIRAITPLLADLFELILKECYNFDINDFVSYNKKKVRKWDNNKLAKYAPEIKKKLDACYNGKFIGTNIYSDHLLKIIEIKSQGSSVYKNCNELRNIESNLRNVAAPEIVSVNSDWIKKHTDITPEKIIKKIETILNYTSVKTKEDYFSSYDRMNAVLARCMFD